MSRKGHLPEKLYEHPKFEIGKLYKTKFRFWKGGYPNGREIAAGTLVVYLGTGSEKGYFAANADDDGHREFDHYFIVENRTEVWFIADKHCDVWFEKC